MKDLFVNTVWIITYFILWPITRIFRPIKISVDKSIYSYPKQATILMSNHRSVFDPWFISSAIPFKTFLRLLPIRILGASDDFKDPVCKIASKIGLIKLIYFSCGVISIRKGLSFEEKTAGLLNALKKGETIMIYPEGHMNRNDDIAPFKRGVAYLYNKTHAKILPFALNYKRNGKRTIKIGAPTDIPEEILSKENYPDSYFEASCEYLRKKVEELYQR